MKYRKRGLVVLGLNAADDKKIALDFLKENGATFPTVLDTSTAAWEATGKYQTLGGMSAVPLTYIIDREGRVVDAWYGYEQGHERGTQALKKLGLE